MTKRTEPTRTRAFAIRGSQATEIFVNIDGDVCIKQPAANEQDDAAVFLRSSQLPPLIAALQALYASRGQWQDVPTDPAE
jgi:hypothetical protein